jgi:hypothetical protein
LLLWERLSRPHVPNGFSKSEMKPHCREVVIRQGSEWYVA